MRGRDKEEDERERERKGEREGFYVAALWMHANHPRTLAANLAGFARFGCLKDLPEILYRFLHGPRDERKDQDDVAAAVQYRRGGPGGKSCKRRCVGGPAAAKARREKEAEHAQAVLARYDSDEAFRNLYDGVADLFAGLLKSDLEHLRAGDTAKIVFAAKWCPSLRSSYDRATLLCEAIARWVFPRDSSPEYLAIPDKHYAYRVRNRLRREVQVPLRKVLELPEVYMSARKWDELPYARAWRPRPCASTRRRPGCASFFWCLHIPWAVRLCADDDVGMVYIVYSFCLISLQSDWCSGAEKYIGWLCLLVWQKAQHVKLIGGHLPQFLHIYIWEVNQATHRLIKAL